MAGFTRAQADVGSCVCSAVYGRCLLVTIRGIENAVVNTTDKNLCFHGVHFLMREIENKNLESDPCRREKIRQGGEYEMVDFIIDRLL